MSDDEPPDLPPSDPSQMPPDTPDDVETVETGPERPKHRRGRPAGWQALNNRPSPWVQGQRIAMIARAIVQGLNRQAIMQAVAGAQRDETVKRAKATRDAERSGADPAASKREALELVPAIWGDGPVATRTIDEYIRRAKEAIGDEGKRLTLQRSYVLGMQLARANDVYKAAFEAKQFGACVRIIREINDVFGVKETVKLMLLADIPVPVGDTSNDGGKALDLSTEAGKAAALGALLSRLSVRDPALATTLSKFAHVDPKQIAVVDAPTLPDATPSSSHDEPKKNGNGNGKR